MDQFAISVGERELQRGDWFAGEAAYLFGGCGVGAGLAKRRTWKAGDILVESFRAAEAGGVFESEEKAFAGGALGVGRTEAGSAGAVAVAVIELDAADCNVSAN